ncbi:MAG: hypothetical protein KI791_23355 [Cyclobacteriaceae bacterium]|nr:hypothetical protein [Cyclobacteriaceae bacterium SS2]
MLRFVLYGTALTLAGLVSAQEAYNLGARNSALGGASLTINDAWANLNNVGMIGRAEDATGAITYQNRYNIPEFMVLGGSYIQTFGFFNSGLSFYRFGSDLYSEQKLGLAVGNTIQMVSIGAGANLIQYRIEGLGSWQYWVLELGGVAQLTDQLFIGAHIFNIGTGDNIPVIMKAGLSYRPISELMINVETHKSLDSDTRFVTGIEYFIIKPLALRTGISTSPFKSAFGLGFLLHPFDINYAFSDQSNLGTIHEVSLNFSLGKP